jgi:RPA family protein
MISDITQGKYIKEDGWNHSYIITPYGKNVSRINVLGIIISNITEESTGYRAVIIDDGTEHISIRYFYENPMPKELKIGSILLVIGRPKEYGEEKYILAEIIKKIDNKAWVDYRKAELDLIHKKIKSNIITKNKENVSQAEQSEEEIIEEEPIFEEIKSPSDELIDLIKNNDKGEGVDFKEIIKIKDAEKIIANLLKEGDIFEIRPGRYKVLE